MKQVLASLASLVWHTFIAGDNGVADRTLGLPFQGRYDVLLEYTEAIGYGAVL